MSSRLRSEALRSLRALRSLWALRSLRPSGLFHPRCIRSRHIAQSYVVISMHVQLSRLSLGPSDSSGHTIVMYSPSNPLSEVKWLRSPHPDHLRSSSHGPPTSDPPTSDLWFRPFVLSSGTDITVRLTHANPRLLTHPKIFIAAPEHPEAHLVWSAIILGIGTGKPAGMWGSTRTRTRGGCVPVPAGTELFTPVSTGSRRHGTIHDGSAAYPRVTGIQLGYPYPYPRRVNPSTRAGYPYPCRCLSTTSVPDEQLHKKVILVGPRTSQPRIERTFPREFWNGISPWPLENFARQPLGWAL
ncbi:hypothetical protein FB45DRAFT_865118 [Roridomyces roridus]|uniref:Uncharacterized protein n=1 Tax=Roridomyces roridus TaxID=1738132 RepID=A0AAD7BYC2_9AGAR|nr:hypothetical protein FB45DRAFT_865118 [Roridomyces roridus]